VRVHQLALLPISVRFSPVFYIELGRRDRSIENYLLSGYDGNVMRLGVSYGICTSSVQSRPARLRVEP
jgi:hypothetical protein